MVYIKGVYNIFNIANIAVCNKNCNIAICNTAQKILQYFSIKNNIKNGNIAVIAVIAVFFLKLQYEKSPKYRIAVFIAILNCNIHCRYFLILQFSYCSFLQYWFYLFFICFLWSFRHRFSYFLFFHAKRANFFNVFLSICTQIRSFFI